MQFKYSAIHTVEAFAFQVFQLFKTLLTSTSTFSTGAKKTQSIRKMSSYHQFTETTYKY